MRQDHAASPPIIEAPAGPSKLLQRLYHDVGLAAVAIELDLIEEDLGEEMEDAIERGARHIAPLNLPLAS